MGTCYQLKMTESNNNRTVDSIRSGWRRLLVVWRPRYQALRKRLLYILAFLWRRLLFRTTFVAITGSVGKSTTRHCLEQMLQTAGRTVGSANNENDAFGVPRTILSVRPWHRYAVIEVAAHGPGTMAPLARLVKPDITAVLCVKATHRREYESLEETAKEKAELPAALKSGGTAIFNYDDQYTRAMAEGFAGRSVLFGSDESCVLRAEAIASAWPKRLSFRLAHKHGELPVNTQLVGKHWVPSVLGALAVAQRCGVSLEEAAAAMKNILPMPGRMQPVNLPSGAVVIRDEQNGSVETLEAMLDVLSESSAQRRILVMGDVADSKAKPRRRMRDFGAIAAHSSEFAVFINERGEQAVRSAVEAGMNRENCRHFASLPKAAEFLKDELRDGDLVFLKGTSSEHLTRAILLPFGRVGCWRKRCGIRKVCELCSLLDAKFDVNKALHS